MIKIVLSKRMAIAIVTLLALIVLVPAGISAWIFFKYKPILMNLNSSHYKFKRTIDISINTEFSINAALDTIVSLPFEKDIKYKIPFDTTLNIPLDTTLDVPLSKPVKVVVDHDFRIDQDFYIKSKLPIDTTVETQVMGVNTELPVKGEIPIDISFPLNDYIKVDEELLCNTSDPISCTIKQSIDVPVKHMIEGVLPIRDTISIPLKFDLPAKIFIQDKIPCLVEFDVYFDLENGIRLEQPKGIADSSTDINQ